MNLVKGILENKIIKETHLNNKNWLVLFLSHLFLFPCILFAALQGRMTLFDEGDATI